MIDKVAPESALRSPSLVPKFPRPEAKPARVCLVGGKRILRGAIGCLLESCGLQVLRSYAEEGDLAGDLESDSAAAFDVVVLILSGSGPFGAFRRIHDTLTKTDRAVPLVVLSEQASRGQVYAALRIGAKAYVNLDAEPGELLKAIEMAARDRVYLAPDAAELLVNDVSTAIEPDRTPRLHGTGLSRREVEVVQLLCEGLSSRKIARHLHISAKTVENHRYNIYRKCEVDSVAGLMRHAIQQGLISI